MLQRLNLKIQAILGRARYLVMLHIPPAHTVILEGWEICKSASNDMTREWLLKMALRQVWYLPCTRNTVHARSQMETQILSDKETPPYVSERSKAFQAGKYLAWCRLPVVIYLPSRCVTLPINHCRVVQASSVYMERKIEVFLKTLRGMNGFIVPPFSRLYMEN